MLRFALCADDYALTPGVSRGILEMLAAGRLTAVSVMVTEPGWPAAAGELRPFLSSADIGLHFNLTLGSPLGAMPGFGASSNFPALALLVRSALLGRLPVTEIGAEIARQIDAFTQHFGRLPDYVDGHQHVHALPGIRDALLRTLREQGLAGRLWLRDPSDRWDAILARPLKGKALAVAALSAGFRRSRGTLCLLPPLSRSAPPGHVPPRLRRRGTGASRSGDVEPGRGTRILPLASLLASARHPFRRVNTPLGGTPRSLRAA